MDLVTQNGYERRHKQSPTSTTHAPIPPTIPPALAKKEKKEEPIQKTQTRNKQDYRKNKSRNINTETTTKKKQMWILRTTKMVTTTQMSGKNGGMQQLPKKWTLRKSMPHQNRKHRNNYLEETYSEEEESEPEEIQRRLQINRILPDKGNNYGIILKINGKYQNFTNDTGSPVAIMPNNPKLYNQKDTTLKRKIPRCEQKGNQIFGESMGKYRIQRRNYKTTSIHYAKKRYQNAAGRKLAKTTANYHQ